MCGPTPMECLLHTKKTKFMLFTRTRKGYIPPKLYLQNNEIEHVLNHKFLGLHFDSKLSWDVHINNLVKTCHSRWRVLKIVANRNWGTDQNRILLLFNSLVLSKIDYGCAIYSSSRPPLLNKVNSLHNLCIRIALGAFKSSPVISLYKNNNRNI